MRRAAWPRTPSRAKQRVLDLLWFLVVGVYCLDCSHQSGTQNMRLLKNFIKASQIPEILRITLFQDQFRTCGGRFDDCHPRHDGATDGAIFPDTTLRVQPALLPSVAGLRGNQRRSRFGIFGRETGIDPTRRG
jgi:hypothetical protein